MDWKTVWETVRSQLQDELGWIRTQGWLEALSLRTVTRGTAWLEVPSAEVGEAVRPHEAAIQRALAEVLGQRVSTRVVPPSQQRRAREPKGSRKGGEAPRAAAPAPEPAEVLEPERLNERLQLSAFLTGPTNELPLRFAREAVAQPGLWNPLVFYGGSGNGKTHLLQGIALDYGRRYPGRRVVYSSSERFARHLSSAARRRERHSFRDLYRHADLLVLDDLQDLVGKPSTERELVHTLDHLTATHRQVVLSCSAPPKGLPTLEAGLEGRILAGLVVPLQSPDRATRREVIRARAAASGLKLDEAVMELLLSGFGESMRDLLGAMTRLEAFRRHVGEPLRAPVVRQILADLLREPARPATIESLAAYVAERLHTRVEALRGRSRKPGAVKARLVAMALTRELTPLTLREVGTWFGGRSCASVHFAQQRAVELLSDDAEVRELWDAACGLFTRPA